METVLLESCTYSRRYVDWEFKSLLRQGIDAPNRVIAITLPNQGSSVRYPARLANWELGHQDCYPRCWQYPISDQQLWHWRVEAYQARTKRIALIDNSLPMMGYNFKLDVCKDAYQ